MFEMFLQQHCPRKGVCVSLCDIDLTFISLSTQNAKPNICLYNVSKTNTRSTLKVSEVNPT